MNAAMKGEGAELSPTQSARLLADRLERIGVDPYRSERERYLVLLEDAPGEIIELGRPLRETQFFKPTALRRHVQMVRDIESFAEVSGSTDWLFWGVGLTGAKAEVANLSEAVREFNRRINIELSELRKHRGFELVLIAIHPRFDAFSGRFDVHAHFICRVPAEHREGARRRLMTRFSKVDLPDDPVRRPGACATYMLWGIFPPDELMAWPDHALRAAWDLTQSRARLVRSGGAFASWKRSSRDPAAEAAARADRSRKRANRAATADPRARQVAGDRFLARITARISGQAVKALLIEEYPRLEPQVTRAPRGHGGSPSTKTSATSSVTQERPVGPPKASKNMSVERGWRGVWPWFHVFCPKSVKQGEPHLPGVLRALKRWGNQALSDLRRTCFRLRGRIRE